MFHLLWALINIAVLIIFISTCFRATRLIKEKYGMLLAVIFVIGLLSFASRNTNETDVNQGSKKIKSWKFADLDSVNAGHPSSFVDVIIDENLINKTRLTIDYLKTAAEHVYR